MKGTFPKTFKDTIVGSKLKTKEIARKCGISSLRLSNLMCDKNQTRMDNIEYRAIRQFVDEENGVKKYYRKGSEGMRIH